MSLIFASKFPNILLWETMFFYEGNTCLKIALSASPPLIFLCPTPKTADVKK
jgi:hypothetical protein